jgi:hypothetical protein
LLLFVKLLLELLVLLLQEAQLFPDVVRVVAPTGGARQRDNDANVYCGLCQEFVNATHTAHMK